MEPTLEFSLETMNLTGQQQPSSVLNASVNDDFDRLLVDFPLYPDNTAGSMSVLFDSNDGNEQLNIDALIDPALDPTDLFAFTGTSDDPDDILKLIEGFSPDDFLNHDQPQQSTFIEEQDPIYGFQSQSVYSPPISVAVGSSPVEPKVQDLLLDAQAFINEQDRLIKTTSKSKKSKNQQRSTTVAPIDYYQYSGDCQPCTTQLQNDFVYQQQSIQYDATESKRIQIPGQPRSKFRPRTQNESKNSSHYIRCEDGCESEYPTISIPQTWNFQSDVNLVEVSLMTIDKKPHPYTIGNKNSSDTFEDHVLIFKQHDPNTLYFRLTNEDFQNGYKNFMIEFIKSKQDDVITKERIRTEQLEHSMLRFTRIFQVGKGDYQRDEGSEAYSNIMTEGYGDVDVEHIGPRYGPMSGQEMVYIVLKGRVVKNDLKIEVQESFTGWSDSIENFTKNGNVIYFMMPAFPFPQFETVKADIVVYFKGEQFFRTNYLYKGSLDQELAELRLNDPCITTSSSSSSSSSSTENKFIPGDFFLATGVLPIPSSRKSSTAKRPKRLNKKT